MEDLGLFVEKKFIVRSSLPLEKAAEKLATINDNYTTAEGPKQRGEWYFAKINYKDANRWAVADVWLEKHANGILFHVLTRYADGKGERHLLNDIAKALEDMLAK